MIAVDLLERFLSGLEPRAFAIELWDGRRYEPSSGLEARFTLVIHSPEALVRFFMHPSMRSLGEAFVFGDVEIQGDLLAAIELGDSLLAFKATPREVLGLAASAVARLWVGTAGSRRAWVRGRGHDRPTRAIRFHYDQPVEFWKLWLDEALVYSCAYFPTEEASLDEAQRAKLDQICCKLELREGERFLDVGCGWGGLLMHAVEQYGVVGEGVTLSKAQYEYVRTQIRERGLQERAAVHCLDLREFAGEARFDKIASVGVIEHIPRRGLEAYFSHLKTLLSPEGQLFNQGITYAPSIGLRGGASFFGAYVFPEGSLVPLHEMLAAAEGAGWAVIDVEGLGSHYARTLAQWRRRLECNREKVIEIADETTYRIFDLYLAGAAWDFERGRNSLHQIVLRRPDQGSDGGPPARRRWASAMEARFPPLGTAV